MLTINALRNIVADDIFLLLLAVFREHKTTE